MNDTRGIGDNTAQINYASEEAERLSRDYAETGRSVAALVARFEAAPAEIEDDGQKATVAALIKDMRDAGKSIEGARELEKMPHFRRGQGVDQFFFGLADRLFRREKRNREGMGDTLLARLTAYDTKKLREEQERLRAERERAEAEARRKAEEERLAREEAARKQREADELAAAAARARNPERIAEKEAAAKQAQQEADTSAAAVAGKATEAEIADSAAQSAHVDSLARPADIMRNRDQTTGVLTTMQREFYAEVENAMLLDKETLWPFIALDAKEKALRAWAKTTGHSQQMTGAVIGSRPKSSVR